MKNQPFTLLAVTLAIFLFSGGLHAQTKLALGQVNLPVRSVTCPEGYGTGTACYSSTLTCPETQEIGFTYGVVNKNGKQGTIVFFNGDYGTTPGFENYVAKYTPPAQDFQTVQVIWSTAWEDTGNGSGDSLKNAACRPATILNWLLNQKNVYGGGGMCAQGASAGSAAIAYALTEYGAYNYLNNVELESGPVLSDMSVGCNPKSPQVAVCSGNLCNTGNEGSWEDSPIYVDGAEDAVSTWTSAYGSSACQTGDNIPQSQYTAWKSMSIVDGLNDSTFNYSKTSVAGWLCSKANGCNGAWCQNNSAAEGSLYFQNVTSSKNVYRVNNCMGPEGVDIGTVPGLHDETGIDAISSDMITQCGQHNRLTRQTRSAQ
jgi:hypothetical protein